MRNRLLGAFAAIGLLTAFIFFVSPERPSLAQNGTTVTGTVPVGSRVLDVWPVIMGGSDGANARAIKTDTSGGLLQGNVIGTTDPCLNSSILKSSKAVSISSATTTSIVAVSGSTAVYICGGALTIAPSATTADTATLEYGTGASCTSPTVLTGAFGAGDVTSAAPPIVVHLNSFGTSMTVPASNGLCILSAGTAVSIQGFISYVQE